MNRRGSETWLETLRDQKFLSPYESCVLHLVGRKLFSRSAEQLKRNTWRKRAKKRGENRLPVCNRRSRFILLTFVLRSLIVQLKKERYLRNWSGKQRNPIKMDRRYSSSSSSTATETAKKVAMNNSIRYRNGLSSDSTISSSVTSHRKSFPSTSDVGSSFNSAVQVRNFIKPILSLSTFCHRLNFSPIFKSSR